MRAAHTRAISSKGHSGPMHISDLEAILSRGVRDPRWRFMYSGWGVKNGLSPGIATLVFGPEAFRDENAGKGQFTVNVTVPQIPEFRRHKYNWRGGSRWGAIRKTRASVEGLGWREVLYGLVLAGKLCNSHELLAPWLGETEFYDLQRGLRGGGNIGPSSSQKIKETRTWHLQP